MKNLFLLQRVYYGCSIIIVLFILSFLFPILYSITWGIVGVGFILILTDIAAVFRGKDKLIAQRYLPEKLSNGDENSIKIKLQNKYSFGVNCEIIDEIPFQFQQRDFCIQQQLASEEEIDLTYNLIPKTRGEYHFGKLNIYVSSPLRLIAKRYIFSDGQMLACYPSFIQMRKYDLIAFAKNKYAFGLKKIRKIGNTTEFEQIKEYVSGDDIRNINWKATAKKNELMVNQFLDENTETVYSIIDKGRLMQMPFEGMTLLDYAINSTLAISNVVLKKNDRVGMLTFSKKVENTIAASNKRTHLQQIISNLYNLKTDFSESDFGHLYSAIKKHITHRSLLLLYTNFESISSLNRQLPYLRAIAKSHVLVVVFFENTELKQLTQKPVKNTDDIIDKIIAEKFNFEKRLIASELTKYGIQSILTTPQNLSIDTINMYLKIKAKGF
ncbi:DUF58 domain-containing protein [Myroides sp. WP-1]|uniref:DUF58 domain-containing protein n=1 Tax=Myroides sp. WP-1 TaxID=2759944 RepID=UPI0015F7E48B|nr:DUF58 domain-containing protein [Myroides sp. WP-1]MBB1140913.1 DUF58 domain-containing protein [Myroides sp. WP-1]